VPHFSQFIFIPPIARIHDEHCRQCEDPEQDNGANYYQQVQINRADHSNLLSVCSNHDGGDHYNVDHHHQYSVFSHYSLQIQIMFAEIPTGIFQGGGIKKTDIKATLSATLITITSVRLRRIGPIAIRFSVITVSKIHAYDERQEAQRHDNHQKPVQVTHGSTLGHDQQQQSDNSHHARSQCIRAMAECSDQGKVERVAYCFATMEYAMQYSRFYFHRSPKAEWR
jgi:hypothetical protein